MLMNCGLLCCCVVQLVLPPGLLGSCLQRVVTRPQAL
jgi:hypothetical protein